MPPALCLISGVVYDVRGNVAAGCSIYCLRTVLSGVIIESRMRLLAVSAADGTVSFSLPRASTAYLFADVEGLDGDSANGTALAIPNAASSTLESLLPVTLVPAGALTHTFLSLTDTPATFVGESLKVARVNVGETALEFLALGSLALVTPTGTPNGAKFLRDDLSWQTAGGVITAEEIQDGLVSFFPDIAPFDWTYDDAGDRVTLNILDATASARGLMSTAYAARLDQLEVGDAPTFAGLTLASGGAVLDDSANEYLKFVKVASAINELSITNAATGTSPSLSATGDGTNIDILLTPKGTGKLIVSGAASTDLITFRQGATDIGALSTGNGLALVNSRHANFYDGGSLSSVGNLKVRIANGAGGGPWLSSDCLVGFFSGLSVSGNPDATISRSAAGVVRIGTTAANALGKLQASELYALASGVGVIPLIAEGPAGQTASLAEFRLNGTAHLKVLAAGILELNGGGGTYFYGPAGNSIFGGSSGFGLNSAGQLKWSSSGVSATTSFDIGLRRVGVGVLGVSDGGANVNGKLDATEYRVAATKVIGAQGAAVADATDNPTAITQLNALLARLRTHGLIAT